MAVVANNLGDALWAAVKTQMGSYSPALTGAEETRGRDFWRAIATAFYTYDLANRQVNPGTLSNPAGQPVATPDTLTGTTTAPQLIVGLGTTS